MSLFSSGTAQEKRTQLFFHDDGSFEFVKRPIVDGCLVQKKDTEVVKAWKHFFGSEIRFDGHKKMPADMVVLGYDRDFILDPFGRVNETDSPNNGKPKTDEDSVKKWTAKIAEAMRYKVMNKPGNMLLLEKITMYLGIGFIIELILFGCKFAFHWGG